MVILIRKSTQLQPKATMISDIKNGNDNNNNHIFSAVAVGAPVGLILVVVVFTIILIGCQACKRTKSREEEMNADENPVYGIYQLNEADERVYSTNEAVDKNVYYE